MIEFLKIINCYLVIVKNLLLKLIMILYLHKRTNVTYFISAKIN